MTENQLGSAMERHGAAVYRLALCRLQHTADAEDVYQEVFLHYFRRGDPAWDDEHTKAFLLRVALMWAGGGCGGEWFFPWSRSLRLPAWKTPAEPPSFGRQWPACGPNSAPWCTFITPKAIPRRRSHPFSPFPHLPSAPGSTGGGKP